MRQAGTINLHLGSSSRSQCAQHVNAHFHSEPLGTGTQLSTCVAWWRWPQVSLQSEGVSGRWWSGGEGSVTLQLLSRTFLRQPGRGGIAGCCCLDRAPGLLCSVHTRGGNHRPSRTFLDKRHKTNQMSEKLLQAHFVPGSEEREISSTRGINRPLLPLTPVQFYNKYY